MLKILLGAAVLLGLATPSLAQDKPVLNVFTYESFTGEYGPGQALKKAFEVKCGCTVAFTTAAFDLIQIEGEWDKEAPKSNPQYYYRPWKTILVRTVADGGESFYVCGDHRQTVPHLRSAALENPKSEIRNPNS